MAGVAGPMLQRSRASGIRFLAGLAVGGAVAGLVLAVPVYLVGHLAGQLLPALVRLGMLGVVAVVLGLADLSGHTPHMWRQVPQSFARSLPPGTRGLMWGFDLGLLFTTQKSTSLLWLAIAAVTLLDPGLAATALVAFSLVASAGISLWSMTPWAVRLEGGWDRAWIRRGRWATGATMLAVGIGEIVVAALR